MAKIRYAGPSIEAQANGAITIGKAVSVIASQAVHADKDDATHKHNIRGLAVDTYADTETACIQIGGRAYLDSWSWTPDLPVYVNTNGDLTQTRPTSGFVTQIGVADAAKEIYVDVLAPETPTSKHTHVRETYTLSGTDITNEFILLAQSPLESSSVSLYIEGAGFINQVSDYEMDGTNEKMLKWTGLGLASIVAAGDVFVIRYYKGIE